MKKKAGRSAAKPRSRKAGKKRAAAKASKKSVTVEELIASAESVVLDGQELARGGVDENWDQE